MSAALSPDLEFYPLLADRRSRVPLKLTRLSNLAIENDARAAALLGYSVEREIVFCGVCGHDFMWEHLPFYPTREGVKQPLCQRCATTPFPELHYRPERFSAVPGRSRRATVEAKKRRPRVSPAVKFARAQALTLRKRLLEFHAR